MAKQLFEYWFLQFEFPDQNGNPYKSSGGRMVWDDSLRSFIPYGWHVSPFSTFVSSHNTGDWGEDTPFYNCIQVGCIRGADIVKLDDLPIRYIKSKNTGKLLSVNDIVIEVSGGSPTQSTGRSALITSGVVKRCGGKITCSNFCHAITLKDQMMAPLFQQVWRLFYDNNAMFNFEGKTSGIKNFLLDAFLANIWCWPPTEVVNRYCNCIIPILTEIDAILGNNRILRRQKNDLLPLLMNGQVILAR